MSKFLSVSFLVVILGLNSLCCISRKPTPTEEQPQSAITEPPVIATATGVTQMEAPTVLPPTAEPQIEQPTAEPTAVPQIEQPTVETDSLPGITINRSQILTITEKIVLENQGQGEATQFELFVALPRTISPLQTMLSTTIDPPDYTVITDDYQNQFAKFSIPSIKPGEKVEINAVFRVEANSVTFNAGDCTGELPRHDIESEKNIESDAPEVMQLSRELAAGKPNACAVTRSIYDYVRKNMTYEYLGGPDQGALKTLQTMTGDATEYADLMTALTRAAGIPAQFVSGVYYNSQSDDPEIAKKLEWVMTYLPGIGWAPVNPYWGKFSEDGDEYFAVNTRHQVIFTLGRNLEILNGYLFYYYKFKHSPDRPASFNIEETWLVQPEP